MAAANASARGQRVAILASPLHELTRFYLAVDCLTPGCNGERTFAIAELASFYGRDCTAGEVCSPHALLEGLWRARRGSVAGDGSDPQCSGQAAAGAAAGAGGTRVIPAASSDDRFGGERSLGAKHQGGGCAGIGAIHRTSGTDGARPVIR